MTRADIDRLFLLLRELYPRIYPSLSQNAKAAWLAVLEPFDYDDVKEKLLAWNRGPKGRNFPDPRECIPERDATEQPEQKRGPVTPEDKLRIMDYLYGYRKGASGTPDPEGYLAALDDWERALDSNGLTDHAARAAIDEKRREITGKNIAGREDDAA